MNVYKDTLSIFMFDNLGWMSVYQCVIYQKYLIMCDIVNNICPKYLSRFICFRSEERIYNLRSSDKCNVHLLFHFLVKNYLRNLCSTVVSIFGIFCL